MSNTFDNLSIEPDSPTAARWEGSQYIHPTKARDTLRQTREGREWLLNNLGAYADGKSHERGSDVAPFVFWDGEGITYEEGKPQQYVLFGSSIGHEVRDVSLRTVDCLALIIQAERDMPNAIHVGFSFKYDAEMILVDLPLRSWWVLRDKGTVRYKGYTITYHPGRLFRVATRVGGNRVTATIYDVFGFFQMSFVKSLRAWLDDEELAEVDRIEQGKDARGSFTYEQLDNFIAPYWRSELRLGVLLMDRLRTRLLSADACPREWFGAGAIAGTLYRRSSIRTHLARTPRDRHDKDRDVPTDLPEDVNEAARLAYFGGRFELIRMGHTDEKVYQYDIRSAYPYAIAMLPSLRDVEWRYERRIAFDSSLFALWLITYDKWDDKGVALHQPQPLPQRDAVGRVSYPTLTRGFYWTPEASVVARDPAATLHGAWVARFPKLEYPFTWVRDLYNERQERKAAGDPSEKAYKLALNSLYGKMAQRLGWQEGGALPRFHQLEWAGWVTSFTRAKLYVAMRQAGAGLIATETDSVFTTKPIPQLTIGTDIGEWDIAEHTWITYIQSGTYWSDSVAKYRGFDRDSLDHDDVMEWLRRADFTTPILGRTTRFVGAGRGLGTPIHRTWQTEAREIYPGATGKRKHVPPLCPQCSNGQSPSEHLHRCIVGTLGGNSHPHQLPWLDGIDDWAELTDGERWDHDDE